MKKTKLKLNNMDVDGPFLRARERLLSFGTSMTFTRIVQATVGEMEECEEEYNLALYMDDPILAREKKKELDALAKSLVYAAKMLEEENGISA